jgi:hypothetical protein
VGQKPETERVWLDFGHAVANGSVEQQREGGDPPLL